MKKKLLVVSLIPVAFTLVAVSLAIAQGSLSPQNPIVIDKNTRTISILAEVNGKYFVEPTRHGVVFKGGKNGDKSIFVGLVDHKTFHEALISTGFKPGNNMTMENAEKTFVQGDLLDVSVT